MNELAERNERNDGMDLNQLGQVLAKSGYFQDTKDAYQAIVKVLAGRELGVGPVASMTGINIIQGRPALGANLIAACVKRSGRYNYRVRQMDEKACSIEFFELSEGKFVTVGTSTFTAEDAQRAGTKNMDKYARNMLFARAMSNGAKWYCADVFSGGVYTPEELGAPVNGDSEVINASAVEFRTVQPQAADQPAAEPALPSVAYEEALVVENSEGVLYGTLDTAKLSYMANAINKARTKGGMTAEKNADHLMKLAAIKIIIETRRSEGR